MSIVKSRINVNFLYFLLIYNSTTIMTGGGREGARGGLVSGLSSRKNKKENLRLPIDNVNIY